MKNTSTLVLKTVVLAIGLAVLGICLVVLPIGIRAELDGDFDYGPIMLGMYVTAIPFFYALYQALHLLKLVDNNNAFSEAAVAALKRIKLCALIISGLFAVGLPYVFYVADRDDAPGVVAVSLIIIGASFLIASTTALFQRIIQNAVDIKSENDLTV